MRVALARALILHRRPYHDTSLLVEAFSRDHGRIGLVARGANRGRARLRGLLRPFAPLLLSWSGRGELVTLTGAEEQERALWLPAGRLLSGLYLNELLIAVLARNDPHPALFDDYWRALTGLATTEHEEPVLRRFEVHLLAGIGYGLQLEHEAGGNAPIQPGRTYRYVLDRGPLPVVTGAGGIIISGRSLLSLAQGELVEPEVLREAKRLTRAALAAHLDKPLHSRALLSALRRRSTHQRQD
jgi:DNA repair protein RecO (recombination protein O)